MGKNGVLVQQQRLLIIYAAVSSFVSFTQQHAVSLRKFHFTFPHLSFRFLIHSVLISFVHDIFVCETLSIKIAFLIR